MDLRLQLHKKRQVLPKEGDDDDDQALLEHATVAYSGEEGDENDAELPASMTSRRYVTKPSKFKDKNRKIVLSSSRDKGQLLIQKTVSSSPTKKRYAAAFSRRMSAQSDQSSDLEKKI